MYYTSDIACILSDAKKRLIEGDTMKKPKILLLAAVIAGTFSLSPHTLASNMPDIVVKMQIDNPLMEINGVKTEIDVGLTTAPVIKNDRTLVPIRSVAETFGGKVTWNEDTRSILLTMDGDEIELTIDSDIAHINGNAEVLDTAPTVINDRTMLPLRFIAESFKLGVAWDESTQTVSLIRNSFDDNEHNALESVLIEYSGQPYMQINNNIPFFKSYEIINGSFEYYSRLDELGRCDVCFASVAKDTMPAADRESISAVTPTGWINASYDNIDGGYIYNRCHLIGFQLTGENANERNLITGTRYLNIDGMLPFENQIADYVNKTENHVLYRSTPVFTDSNSVADGVLLEAYSVEDNGGGISFCVFCYNVQPGITIDYLTGESSYSGQASVPINDNTASKIYRTPSGKKYHSSVECGGKNSYEISWDEAVKSKLTPCSKCIGSSK